MSYKIVKKELEKSGLKLTRINEKGYQFLVQSEDGKKIKFKNLDEIREHVLNKTFTINAVSIYLNLGFPTSKIGGLFGKSAEFINGCKYVLNNLNYLNIKQKVNKPYFDKLLYFYYEELLSLSEIEVKDGFPTRQTLSRDLIDREYKIRNKEFSKWIKKIRSELNLEGMVLRNEVIKQIKEYYKKTPDWANFDVSEKE